MARPQYTDEVRQRAIDLCVQHGPAEARRLLAAEGHEIAAGTIRVWASRAGAVTVTSQKTAAATAAATARYEQRRSLFADRIGHVTDGLITELEIALAAGAITVNDLNDARALATTIGILVDKAQLLSGGATSRADTITRDQAHQLVDELARRRNAA